MNIDRKSIFQRMLKQVWFILGLYAVLAVLIAFEVIPAYPASIITIATIFVIVALGLNLVTGMTGQLLLGQAGFMALGAYSTAILLNCGFPMLPALLLGASLAAIVSFALGFFIFRLRGDYLAIVTLGIGEIIVVVLNNLEKLTGGASGLVNIRSLSITFGNATLTNFLWVSMFMVLTILALVHLLTSSHGRAILSVREDEVSAEAMGINIFYTKLYVFVISAFLAGIAGGLYATQYGAISPSLFNFLQSINIVIIVVFGGLGSFTGTVIASYVLILLQELVLRNLPSDLKDLRLVIYPLLLILMMIFRPKGLLGTKELMLLDTLLSRKWWHNLPSRLKATRKELDLGKGGKSDENT